MNNNKKYLKKEKERKYIKAISLQHLALPEILENGAGHRDHMLSLRNSDGVLVRAEMFHKRIFICKILHMDIS